jgi:hypothetical protein
MSGLFLYQVFCKFPIFTTTYFFMLHYTLFLLVLVFGAQHPTSTQKAKKVKTVGVFNMTETKSGYQINDYYVALTKEEVLQYNNQKVEVRGKLVVVPGLDPNEKIISQGSTSERKFIVDYKIKLLKK